MSICVHIYIYIHVCTLLEICNKDCKGILLLLLPTPYDTVFVGLGLHV